MALIRDIFKDPTFRAKINPLVSIEIDPQNYVIEAGGKTYFLATGTYADGTRDKIPQEQVTWDTSRTDIVSIAKDGNTVTSVAGTATVTATSGGITAKTTITVKAEKLLWIIMSPKDPSKVGGGDVQFSVKGVYDTARGSQEYQTSALPADVKVKWSSSAPNIASVDQTGHAIIKGIGSAVITADAGVGTPATSTLTVVSPGPGACKANVEINVLNANGREVNAVGVAIFRSKEFKPVEVRAPIKGGYFFVNATVMPHGHLEFSAIGESGPTASSGVEYDMKGDSMRFNAKQTAGSRTKQTGDQEGRTTGQKTGDTVGHKTVHTTGHKTSKEDELKSGSKANIGVEIEGVGIGVEGNQEVSNKRSQEDSEENSEENSEEHSQEKSEERSRVHQEGESDQVPLGLDGFELKQTK